MSVSAQSLTISIQGLQLESDKQASEKFDINVIRNSTRTCIFEDTNFQNSCSLPHITPKDIIQIILMKHNTQEYVGSISFLLDSFLDCEQQKFSQWVTLARDFNEDFFDTNFPIEDKQAPKLRIGFQLFCGAATSSDKDSETLTIPSQNARNEREYLNVILLESDSLSSDGSEKTHIRILTDDGFDDKNSSLRTEIEDRITTHLRTIKGSLKGSRNGSISLRNMSSLVPVCQSSSFLNTYNFPNQHHLDSDHQNGILQEKEVSIDLDESSVSITSNLRCDIENPMTNLRRDFANDFALLSNKLKQATDLAKNAKNLKGILTRRDSDGINLGEDAHLSKYNVDESVILKSEKDEINNHLEEARSKIKILEEENSDLKKNEALYAEKLLKVNSELERLRIGAVNHERLVDELQKELNEVKEQVKDEIDLRLKLQKEKDNLSEALDKAKEEVEQAKYWKNAQERLETEEFPEKESEPVSTKMINVSAKSFNGLLLIGLQQPRQNIEDLDVVLQASAPITQRTQIRDDFSDGEAEEPLIATVMPSNYISSKPILEEEIVETKNERVVNSHNSEARKPRESETLSKTDKLIIDSMMNQIKHLQSYIKSLEKEKESLKDELFRSNENYSNLTAKYFQLTERLANGVGEESRVPFLSNFQGPATHRGMITPRETQNTEGDEEDELQIKLNEFMLVNKIPSSSFARVDKNTYLFNEKKIYLKVLHKRLITRINGNLQTMDEFWRAYKAKERTKTPSPLTRLTPTTAKSYCNTPERRLNQSIVVANKIGSKRTSDKMTSKERLDNDKNELPKEIFDATVQKENSKEKEAVLMKYEDKKRKLNSSISREKMKKV